MGLFWEQKKFISPPIHSSLTLAFSFLGIKEKRKENKEIHGCIKTVYW